MVIAVQVGPGWRAPCLRWHILGTCRDAGEVLVAAGRQGRITTHSLRREVLGEGALRGRSPRTKEGRIGPTAQLQWSVVSSQWSVKTATDGR